MHLILLSRDYVTPFGYTLRVSLLQDTDTMRKAWEVRSLMPNGRGWVGVSSRAFASRSEAMRLVRRSLYSS
jgi:hypothetical protein